MSESLNFPTVMPSLLLDFANRKSLDPRITFTRASTATYYDEDTVALAEQNLLTYSQEFDNAAWENPGAYASITANTTTAPDGTLTADTMAQTAVTNYFLIQQNKTITANTTYVFSVYAKNVNIDYVAIELYGANSNFAYAEFNLTTGALNRSSATGTGWSLGSTSIQSVGAGGWYRISAVITAGTTVSSPRQRIFLTDGTTAISATTGLSVFAGTSLSAYLWGAQLEQRSAVTAYTPTTTAPITNYIPVLMTAAVGVPRFDFNPTTRESLGLLIEEQRTNNILASDNFGNATYWAVSAASVSTDQITSPDGTQNADKLIDTVANSTHYVAQSVSFTNGVTYTASVYAKAGEYSKLFFRSFAGIANCVFDLSAGTATPGAGTATISNVGNGWYRCTITGTATSTGSAQIVCYLVNAAGTITFAGTGSSGLYLWGCQNETGSFSTSYIPTVASSVTRSADAASMTGVNFSQWYRTDEGTAYVEAAISANPSDARAVFEIGDGTLNNRFNIQRNASANSASNVVVTSGAIQAAISISPAFVPDANSKAIFAYKVNDFAASINGSAASTDLSGLVPATDRLAFGATTTGLARWNGTIKKLAYYPWRLTNAQLQALTS